MPKQKVVYKYKRERGIGVTLPLPSDPLDIILGAAGAVSGNMLRNYLKAQNWPSTQVYDGVSLGAADAVYLLALDFTYPLGRWYGLGFAASFLYSKISDTLNLNLPYA